MPCEPVWLATMTGKVLASVLVSRAAKKYSFQQSTTERMKAATMPGSAIGSTMRRKAPQTVQPSTRAACSELLRDGVELVAHDPDHDRQHHQRVDEDQADLRVQQRQFLVEDRGTASPGRRAAGSSCDRKKNEMSLFRQGPNLYWKRLRP